MWVTGEELCQEGILLSPRMMEDHYALSLQACTQRLAISMLAGCHHAYKVRFVNAVVCLLAAQWP